MQKNSFREKIGFKISAGGAALMAALGIGFYFLTGSHAILLDGMFSVVNMLVALISLKIAGLAAQPTDDNFNLGYLQTVPLLNLAKGLIMTGILIIAFISAVFEVMAGGKLLPAGLGALYAVIASAGCFMAWGYISLINKRRRSALLNVEQKAWLIDGLLSLLILAVFIAAFLLRKTSIASWLKYLDPALVIFMVIALLPIPFVIIKQNLWDLLLAAPPGELRRDIEQHLNALLESRDMRSSRTIIVKTGGALFVDATVFLSAEQSGMTVQELDEVKLQIFNDMKRAFPAIEASLFFTASRELLPK